MKSTSAGSSRDGSLDENLPLYEEFQCSDQHGNALPSAKATPAEIVDFLVHLLVSTDMPVDQARRVAAKWTRGSGQELRSYPPAMYFEIFGKEDGWITYREVKMALHNERNKGIWYRYGTYIVLAVLLCFEAIAVAITFSDLNENVRIVAGVASFAGGMSCFFTSVLACVTLSQSPRKTIEAELRIALNKGIPQQS